MNSKMLALQEGWFIRNNIIKGGKGGSPAIIGICTTTIKGGSPSKQIPGTGVSRPMGHLRTKFVFYQRFVPGFFLKDERSKKIDGHPPPN
jgi:hypothetical protein